MLPADAGSSALFGNATSTVGNLTSAAWDRSKPSAKAIVAQSAGIARERALRNGSVQDRATNAMRFMVRHFDVIRRRMGLIRGRARWRRWLALGRDHGDPARSHDTRDRKS